MPRDPFHICKNCVAFAPSEVTTEQRLKAGIPFDVKLPGVCRLLPPGPLFTPQGLATAHPHVAQEDWCLQFAAETPTTEVPPESLDAITTDFSATAVETEIVAVVRDLVAHENEPGIVSTISWVADTATEQDYVVRSFRKLERLVRQLPPETQAE